MIYTKLEDLTGKRYERLVVKEFAGFHEQPSGKRRSQWKCACDCGNEVVVTAINLKTGNSKSCGCLNKERIISRFTKHSGRHSRLYGIWSGMKNRCYNQNCQDYPQYGGRGIKLCEAWMNDFESFRQWAYSNGYKDTLSIDRIDVNGDYKPENCRWATPAIQSNNRTNTIFVEAFGKQQSLSDWAKEYGIKYHTLYARIYKLGMSPEQALNYIK